MDDSLNHAIPLHFRRGTAPQSGPAAELGTLPAGARWAALPRLVQTYGDYGYFRWTLLDYFPAFMLGIVMADLTRDAPYPRRRGGTSRDLLCLGSVLVLPVALHGGLVFHVVAERFFIRLVTRPPALTRSIAAAVLA
jgi:hypothetical protein